MQRVITALRKKNGEYKVPRFSECLIEFFSKDTNFVRVNCSDQNGIFLLNESEEGYELRHSPECPIKLLSQSGVSGEDLESDMKKKVDTLSIGVAASVVVESSDSHILLTKRAAHMRSSPNVWVVPGGHVESGETIFEAGVREVKEETGLDISNGKTTLLALWENVYPLILGIGMPKNHVLIVYLHTQLNETHEQLTSKILPNPEEVDSYTWLSLSSVCKLLNKNVNFNLKGKQYIFEKGKIIEKDLDYSKMFNKWLWKKPEPYSGINYVLKIWVKKMMHKNQHCKL